MAAPPDLQLSGSFTRHIESGEGVAKASGWTLPWIPVQELAEQDWGIRTGYSMTLFRDQLGSEEFDIMRHNPLLWRPEGGESIRDVAFKRLFVMLQRIALLAPPRNIVFCMTSQETFRAARVLFENLNAQEFLQIYEHGVQYGECICYKREPDGYPQLAKHFVPLPPTA